MGTLDYNREHWEGLMVTIIKRVGLTEFLDHVLYAVEESGHPLIAKQLERCRHDLRYFAPAEEPFHERQD